MQNEISFQLESSDYFQTVPHEMLLLKMDRQWSGWHQGYELLLLLTGCLHIQWYERAITLHPGEMVFLRPNLLHRLIPIGGACQFLMNRFSTDVVSQFPEIQTLSDQNGQVSADSLEAIRDVVLRLYRNELRQEAGSQFQRAGLLYEALGLLMQQNQNSRDCYDTESNSRLGRVQFVIDKIIEDPDVDWSPERMADCMKVSAATLQRDVRRYIGVSFTRLLQILQIDRAKRLLVYEKLSVERIANLCGYRNMTSFYRSFKAQTGVQPSTYRKKVVRENRTPYKAEIISPDAVMKDIRLFAQLSPSV